MFSVSSDILKTLLSQIFQEAERSLLMSKTELIIIQPNFLTRLDER